MFIRICAIPDTRLTTDERLKALEREETGLPSRIGKPQGKKKFWALWNHDATCLVVNTLWREANRQKLIFPKPQGVNGVNVDDKV